MAVGAFAVAGLGLGAMPAMAAIDLQVYEIAGPPTFTGNGGPGSTFFVEAVLVDVHNHNNQVGYRNEWCIIEGNNAQGHSMMWCTETNVINGKGSILAQGDVDRTNFEAGVVTTLVANGTGGIYSGHFGTEVLQQIVFPNQILVTFHLN